MIALNMFMLTRCLLCQFVGLSPFGTDGFLKSRLRRHLAEIKEDDREILAEGIESMTDNEIREGDYLVCVIAATSAHRAAIGEARVFPRDLVEYSCFNCFRYTAL